MHTLYLLHFGWLIERVGRIDVHIPVPGYLIRTGSGAIYLVDAGNPKALIGVADCQPWYPARCDIRPDDDPVARLAELDLAPGDLSGVLLSHLDFDHCGRLDAFVDTGVPVWVQREHVVAAREDRETYDGSLWDMSGLEWQLVDGDREIEPGLSLIQTPGHAAGHQSVAVKTNNGWVILTIDAADNARMFANRRFPASWPDRAAATASCDRLEELQRQTGAFLIFGHDARQWPTLMKSPNPFVPPR